MSLIRTFIHVYLYIPFLANKLTGAGAFGPDGARPLAGPAAMDANRLKAALFRHHVRQFNGAACSVATVVSVVNALGQIQGGRTAPVGQREILDTVLTGHWKERMHGQGYRGRRGLPLALLGRVVQASLNTYGIAYRAVETVGAPVPGTAAARRIESVLRSRLHRFETRGDGVLIAHFDQGALAQTLNIPHISPVGGFDTQSASVTVLDVDPEQQSPYQVPFRAFYRSISSNYNHVFRPFGYDRGGYVYVRLE